MSTKHIGARVPYMAESTWGTSTNMVLAVNTARILPSDKVTESTCDFSAIDSCCA